MKDRLLKSMINGVKAKKPCQVVKLMEFGEAVRSHKNEYIYSFNKLRDWCRRKGKRRGKRRRKT